MFPVKSTRSGSKNTAVSQIIISQHSKFNKKSSDESSLDTFAKELKMLPNKGSTDKVLTIKEECAFYISSMGTSNLQKFWNLYQNKLPMLASVVRNVNIIPATSVASESAFSLANYVQRKERSSLSSKI